MKKKAPKRNVVSRSISMLPHRWKKLDRIFGKGGRSKAVSQWVDSLKEKGNK